MRLGDGTSGLARRESTAHADGSLRHFGATPLDKPFLEHEDLIALLKSRGVRQKHR